MKKLNKKEIAARNKEFAVVEEALQQYGAEDFDSGVPWFKSYLVKTKCGPLRVSLDYGEDDGTRQYSIYCRFETPQLACKALGLKPTFKDASGRQMYDASCSRLNQYSGKWNFHFDDITDLVTQFFLEFSKVEIKEIKELVK